MIRWWFKQNLHWKKKTNQHPTKSPWQSIPPRVLHSDNVPQQPPRHSYRSRLVRQSPISVPWIDSCRFYKRFRWDVSPFWLRTRIGFDGGLVRVVRLIVCNFGGWIWVRRSHLVGGERLEIEWWWRGQDDDSSFYYLPRDGCHSWWTHLKLSLVGKDFLLWLSSGGGVVVIFLLCVVLL